MTALGAAESGQCEPRTDPPILQGRKLWPNQRSSGSGSTTWD